MEMVILLVVIVAAVSAFEIAGMARKNRQEKSSFSLYLHCLLLPWEFIIFWLPMIKA